MLRSDWKPSSIAPPDDFALWSPRERPVPPGARVECVLVNGIRASGVAVAFNWGHGDDRVAMWRFDRKATTEIDPATYLKGINR